MKRYKQVVCACAALFFVALSGMRAQTKAVPEDPAVPHFIKLENTDGGTLTGQVTIDGQPMSLVAGGSYNFPHGTEIQLTASPETGQRLGRVTEKGADGQEKSIQVTNYPTGEKQSFTYTLTQTATVKAYFAARVYLVNWQLEHLTTNNQPTGVEHGGKFDFVLTPDPGYLLPETISIGHWEEGTEFSYNRETGEVKILVDLEYAITIYAKAKQDISVIMKWNSFTGRYFETNKEGKANYGIQTSDRETPLMFRYIIADYEKWKDVLTMSYADNNDMNNSKSFDFSANGTVDIKSSEIRLLPDAYNTNFSFISTVAGELTFRVDVYDESGVLLYGTLEGNKILFADPVSVVISPDLKGYVNTDIEFGITLGNLKEELSSVGNGRIGFEIHGGLNAEDLTLCYGDKPIKLEAKNEILYASFVDVGSLKEGSPYLFTISSKVSLSAENKIIISVSDSHYSLPIGVGREILPDISIQVKEPEDDRLGLEIPEDIKEGEPVILELRLVNPIILRYPRQIEVVMNDKVLEEVVDYTYNEKDGSIYINEVSGNIEVRAFAVANDEVEVYYALEGLTIQYAQATEERVYAFGEVLPKAGEKVFVLTSLEGYELPASVTVKINGTELESDQYTYVKGSPVRSKAVSGVETATLTLSEEVVADAMVVDIIAEGTLADPDPVDPVDPVDPSDPDLPTSNADIESMDLKVWTTYGCLRIQSPISDTAYIFTINGRLYKVLSVSAGETMTTLPKGSFVVHIGNRSYKLWL